MTKKQKGINHYHSLVIVFAASLLVAALYVVSQMKSGIEANFDSYGYNYKARIFNGTLDGADRNWDGTYWGDKTYAKDKLVMKWSKAWDDARFNGKPWNSDAWVDNEFNGKAKDGSGEVWHYKIVWVGPELQKSSYWREGGYPIWGQFEVIFSQGVANEHFWEAHARPGGYGMY